MNRMVGGLTPGRLLVRENFLNCFYSYYQTVYIHTHVRQQRGTYHGSKNPGAGSAPETTSSAHYSRCKMLTGEQHNQVAGKCTGTFVLSVGLKS